jgi:hypothetical protein
MTKEIRNIYFSETEIKKALINFSTRNNKIFNIDNINEIKINTKDPISVILLVFNVESGKVDTLKYEHAEIAAALMAFCMTLKVPLPRDGKKALHANDNGLFLSIKVG